MPRNDVTMFLSSRRQRHSKTTANGQTDHIQFHIQLAVGQNLRYLFGDEKTLQK